MRSAGERVALGGAELGKRAAKYLENHPRARSAVARGQEIIVKGTRQSAPALTEPQRPFPTA